jgi:hypothetical protein
MRGQAPKTAPPRGKTAFPGGFSDDYDEFEPDKQDGGF